VHLLGGDTHESRTILISSFKKGVKIPELAQNTNIKILIKNKNNNNGSDLIIIQ